MPTVKELREQAKSYGLRCYSTLRKPGLIRLIAQARAPVIRERLKRALKTGRYPALRGDIDNPHKKAQRTITWKLLRGLAGSVVDSIMTKVEALQTSFYLRFSYTCQ